MDITITLNWDTNAFYETPEDEVCEILNDLIYNIGVNGLLETSLTDFDGNFVGKMKITK